jgi:hypothetical protein
MVSSSYWSSLGDYGFFFKSTYDDMCKIVATIGW